MAGIPMDQREGWIWYNGEFVEWKQATCHILNHGLHYASSVFEGERAYNRKIFKLEEHTERLRFSANELGFDLPFSNDEINQACLEIVERNQLVNAYLRPFAWRGSETLGISSQDSRIHVAIAGWEMGSYFDPEKRKQGIRLTWSKWKRPSPESAPVHAKAAGLYMICTHAKHAAEDAGYQDALMLDYRGYVAECTGANIFFITKQGELHTPIADCFLNGITRRTVIDLARQAGYKVVERHIKPEELKDFTEVFVTGSAAEVTAIAEIDGIHYQPGEITEAMDTAYMAAVGA